MNNRSIEKKKHVKEVKKKKQMNFSRMFTR